MLRCVNVAKRYTLTLKDELLPPDPDTGREQSTVSYEYDFVARVGRGRMKHPRVTRIRVPWANFTATYRGKEKRDAPPLDRRRVRRLSLMMRR